jgi:heptosyltransferase-2
VVAAQLRRTGVDLAVLFTNSWRTALVAWSGRCRRRVGYRRNGRALLLTDRLLPRRDNTGRLSPSPVIDAYNRLAERVGCPAPGYRMELGTTAADERAATEIWRETGLESRSEVVCLNPGGAFGAAKHWPTQSFARLARDLVDRRGSGVLVLCGPGEQPMARAIANEAQRPSVHSLAERSLSLGLIKACVRRADLLVTTDSGPRHFAAAFDRPVVTLFGPTHIAWTETYYARAIHLQKQVDCGPCQLRVCPLDHRCMKLLTPPEVLAAATSLLEQTRADGPAVSC